MYICMTCGTIVESNKAWPECEKGIDDDFCSPEKLACGDCIQRVMRKSTI